MKLKPFLFVVTVALIFFSCGGSQEGTADYAIIPQPQQINPKEQVTPFVLDKHTSIVIPTGDSEMETIAGLLNNYICECTGYQLPISFKAAENSIILSIDTTIKNPEGYRFSVNSNGITLAGGSYAGVFYGVQALRKASPLEACDKIVFNSTEIEDYPRLSYRGMHLDVGRHFFTVEQVKQYLDLMALHNLNVFHWHLTDDQGWRIEIKKYPLLTEIGSKRKESVRTDGVKGTDGKPYGGFYTQEDIREIVQYAADRYIEVIPEIDLPGHIKSALAAYPELGCTGGPYETAVEYGVHKDVLCVGSDKTLPFVKDVLAEVMQLFPSKYIHIGGDECPRDRWKECPKCQALVKAKGWKDTKDYEAEDKLQSYFMTEVEGFVEASGRRIIGWDEILAGGATPNATVMAWRSAEYGAEVVHKGHNVIMTPCGQFYFSAMDVLNLPGDNAIRKVYDFNPVLDGMTEADAAHVKGIQACLWTEDIETMEQVEHRVLPRLAVLAEITWTGFDKPARDYYEFASRMFNLIKRYDKYGLSYHKGAFEVTSDYENDTQNRKLSVRLNTLGDRKLYYTLDGSEPTEASLLYEGPFSIDSSAVLRAKVIMPGEVAGNVLCDTISVNKATFCPVTLAGQPSPSYTYKGASILTDGLTGDTRYNTGRWLGFLCDFDATVDLGKAAEVSSAAFRTDVSIGSAVMDIIGMEVWCSADGTSFTKVAESSKPVLTKDDRDGIYRHELTFETRAARYVRIVGKVTPKLPKWHIWPGGDAFIFVDEIYVN